MTAPLPTEPFRHLLYLHRREILDRHREHVTRFFAERFPDVRVSLSDGSSEPLPRDVDCLIAPAAAWIEPMVKRLPLLRWIHFTGSGADAVLDLLRARPDLLASKAAGVNSVAMAEFALAAILYFAKEFDRFARQQRQRRWDRLWLSELSGRHLVILGAGAVAEAFAPRAAALGLRTTVVARTAGPRRALPHVEPIDALPELLSGADFVVCTLPLTDATRGLIGRPQFRAMRPQAVFVNISRGGIVDEIALAEALHERWIRGAAVDVFDDEPLPPASPLWRCPSLLITPHVAGTSDRYLSRLLQSFETNWNALHASGRLGTPVDPSRGY